MPSTTYAGYPGIPTESKPLILTEADKCVVVFRKERVAKAFVKSGTIVREFIVTDCGVHWKLGIEQKRGIKT